MNNKNKKPLSQLIRDSYIAFTPTDTSNKYKGKTPALIVQDSLANITNIIKTPSKKAPSNVGAGVYNNDTLKKRGVSINTPLHNTKIIPGLNLTFGDMSAIINDPYYKLYLNDADGNLWAPKWMNHLFREAYNKENGDTPLDNIYTGFKHIYNNSPVTDILNRGLSLDFDTEVANAKNYYHKEQLTLKEISDWLEGGKKVIGKQLRQGETLIADDIYLWHGKVFVGDTRIPLTSNTVPVRDRNGNIKVISKQTLLEDAKRSNEAGTERQYNSHIIKDKEGNDLLINEYGNILFKNGKITVPTKNTSPATGYNPELDLDKAANDDLKRQKEWLDFIKLQELQRKKIVELQDIPQLRKFLNTGEYNKAYDKIVDELLKTDPENILYVTNHPDSKYTSATLYSLIIRRFRTLNNANYTLDAYRDLLFATASINRSEGLLTEEQYQQLLEDIASSINNMKEALPENKDVLNFISKSNDSLNEALRNIKENIINIILKLQIQNYLNYKKSVIKDLNNSAFAKDDSVKDDDTTLQLKDNGLLGYFNEFPMHTFDILNNNANKEITNIVETTTDIVSTIDKDRIEEIKGDPDLSAKYQALGKWAAKNTPGFTSDSDDILHLVLYLHGYTEDLIGFRDNLTEEQTKLAYMYLGVLNETILNVFTSSKDAQLVFQEQMLLYDYRGLGVWDRTGMFFYQWGTTLVGSVASIFGAVVTFFGNFASPFDFEKNWQRLLENPWSNWAERLKTTGRWTTKGLEEAELGEAFTQKEIQEFIDAGLFDKVLIDEDGNEIVVKDQDTIDALMAGTLRTGGGGSFGIFKSATASEEASGSILSGDGIYSFAKDASAMVFQMAATSGIGGLLGKLGQGMTKLGSSLRSFEPFMKSESLWLSRLGNKIHNVLNVAGHVPLKAGIMTQVFAPHLASAGLNYGYALSSYREHLLDAKSKLFSSLIDEILEAPTPQMMNIMEEKLAADPNALYGPLSEEAFNNLFIPAIIQEETNRLIEETSLGIRNTAFLKNKRKDENGEYDYSEDNIDTAKIIEYVTNKINKNRRYVYMMKEYMENTRKAAIKSTAIEMGAVTLADASLLLTLKPAFLFSETAARGASAIKNNIKAAFTKVTHIGSPMTVLGKSSRSIKSVIVDSQTGKLIDVVANTLSAKSILGKRIANSIVFGFTSNYLQDVGVGFDKSFYNSVLAKQIAITYSPAAALTLMGSAIAPSLPENPFISGFRGAMEAATDLNSVRDGAIGAIGGWFSPGIKFGKVKAAPKDAGKFGKAWHYVSGKFSGITFLNDVTSFIKASAFGRDTKTIKDIKKQNTVKIKYTNTIRKILEERGLGILDNIELLKREVKRVYAEEAAQQAQMSELDLVGVKIESPIQNNTDGQLALAECLTELANSTFIDETGKKIKNGKNPAARLYLQYIENKGNRGYITAERIKDIWDRYNTYVILLGQDLFEVFSNDKEALGVIEDIKLYLDAKEEQAKKTGEAVDDLFITMANNINLIVTHVNRVTADALLTRFVTDRYIKNLFKSTSVLGELDSNDPIVQRLFAKELTKIDVIENNIKNLNKLKKELSARLQKINTKQNMEEKVNIKSKLAGIFIRLGYNIDAANKELQNIDNIITSIEVNIKKRQDELDDLLNECREYYKLSKESTEEEVIEKIKELMAKERESYEKRYEAANELDKESIDYSLEYKSMTLKLKRIQVLQNIISNLNRFCSESAPTINTDGVPMVSDVSLLTSLEQLKNERRLIQEIYDELAKLNTGKKVKAINGKIEEGQDTSSLILSANLIINAMMSGDINLPLMLLILQILTQHKAVTEGNKSSNNKENEESEIKESNLLSEEGGTHSEENEAQPLKNNDQPRYSSLTMKNQVESLVEIFGNDLEMLREMLGLNLSLYYAQNTLENSKNDLKFITRNSEILSAYAVKARNDAQIALYRYHYELEGFASDIETYQEFVLAYNKKLEELKKDNEKRNEGLEKEDKAENDALLEAEIKGLNKALLDNPFFKELQNRQNSIKHSVVSRAIDEVCDFAESKKIVSQESSIVSLLRELLDDLNTIMEKLLVESPLLRTILRNLLEQVALFSEKGMPNKIEDIIDTFNDLSLDMLDRVVQLINALLEVQNKSISIDLLSELIIPILTKLLLLIKENNNKAVTIMLNSRMKQGEALHELILGQLLESLDGDNFTAELRFTTFLAALGSYLPHLTSAINAILSMNNAKGEDIGNDKSLLDALNAKKMAILGISPLLLSAFGTIAKRATDEQLLSLLVEKTSSSDLQAITDILDNIYNMLYDSNITFELVIAEAIENFNSNKEDGKNYYLTEMMLDTILKLVSKNIAIPLAYDRVLITPQQQLNQARNSTSGTLTIIGNQPFLLSDFYRNGDNYMSELMTEYNVEQFLLDHCDALLDRLVVFLYNTSINDTLIYNAPGLKSLLADKSIVAVAIKIEGEPANENDKRIRIGEDSYQIVGFLPTNSNISNLFRGLNSAAVVRRNVNQSIEKHKSDSKKQGRETSDEDWIPVYDFSDEKNLGGTLITTKITKVVPLRTTSSEKITEDNRETFLEKAWNRTKDFMETIGVKNSKRFRRQEKGYRILINTGTEKTPVWVTLIEPAMKNTISNGVSFSSTSLKFKRDSTHENSKKIINFNSKTRGFASLLRDLLSSIDRYAKASKNLANINTVISDIINGVNPANHTDVNTYAIWSGYEEFHAYGKDAESLTLGKNIYCNGGFLYRAKIDGMSLRLWVEDASGKTVDGTTISIELGYRDANGNYISYIDENGNFIRESAEQAFNKAVAEFIVGLSLEVKVSNKKVDVANFSRPRKEFTDNQTSLRSQLTRELALNDGLYIIPETVNYTDVTIDVIQDAHTKQLYENASSEGRSKVENVSNEPENIAESVKSKVLRAINNIVKSVLVLYPMRKKGNKLPINTKPVELQQNFGASSREVRAKILNKEYSDATLVSLILGDIVDDMAKKIAANIECNYNDYKSILTKNEFIALNTMIKNGMSQFTLLKGYTPVRETGLSNALEVVLIDLLLRQELADAGLDTVPPHNILDLLFVDKKGNLAIVDIKTHLGNTLSAERVASYVNLLNTYAALLNKALSGQNISSRVTNLHLFEIPTRKRTNMNYGQEFHIIESSDSGTKTKTFERRPGSKNMLIDFTDRAHVTTYATWSSTKMDLVLTERRKSIIESLLLEQKIKEGITDAEVVFANKFVNNTYVVLRINDSNDEFTITITKQGELYKVELLRDGLNTVLTIFNKDLYVAWMATKIVNDYTITKLDNTSKVEETHSKTECEEVNNESNNCAVNLTRSSAKPGGRRRRGKVL